MTNFIITSPKGIQLYRKVSQSLLERIRDDYNHLYKIYSDIIKKLKNSGIKVRYIKPDTL